MSINRVNISGNLTRDPELRAMPSGTTVLSFGVAVNDRVQDKQSGEWTDRPNFIDCVIFGNRAQSLSRIMTKGMKVAIEGRLRWSQWQDTQTGKNRSKIEVVVDEVELMQRRDDQQGGYQQGYPQQYGQQGYQQPRYPQQAPQQPQYAQPQQGYRNQYAYQAPQPVPMPQPAPQPAQQQLPVAAPQPAQQQAPAPHQTPQATAPQQAQQAPQAPQQAQQAPQMGVYDEDIPF